MGTMLDLVDYWNTPGEPVECKDDFIEFIIPGVSPEVRGRWEARKVAWAEFVRRVPQRKRRWFRRTQ